MEIAADSGGAVYEPGMSASSRGVGVVLIASDRNLPAAEIMPPQHPCSPEIDLASLLPGGAHEDPDVASALAAIDKEEASAMHELEDSPPSDLSPDNAARRTRTVR